MQEQSNFINFNEHISKTLLNEFGGSEKKKTVILDDGKKYMLKFPNPMRKNNNIVYINNVFSEYIGCRIFKSAGFDVQNTILGTYTDKRGKEKIICACEDICGENESLYEMEKICLGLTDKHDVITFDSIKNILEKLSINGTNINASDTYREYCRRFVIDAFIGTPDRNNSNWGILVNGKTGETRLAPVYDCGASMLPFISDEELACNEGSKDIAATIVSSAVYNKAGEKIQYYSYMLSHDDPELDKAIRDIIPVIDLRKISEIINNIPYISKIRKDFYNSVLKTRYEQILMPALKNQGV